MNAIKITRFMISGLAVAGLGLGSAWADSSHRYDRGDRNLGSKGHSRQTFAKVVAVEPIMQSVAQRIPHRQCWTEQVRYQGSNDNYRSNTAAIVGGIVGAAIGNSIGRGHHRDNKNIKTLAGGLLGAAIGGDIGARSRDQYAPVEYRNEQRCTTEYETQWQQTISAYNVTYRYQGETYHTRMNYDPGDKIRVHVQVRPVF